MSLRELHARYRRQSHENAAWRLLRATNAPLVLAFITELFNESNDVLFSRAKAALELELSQGREEDWFESEKSAATYLREWIQAGWLRELDDNLSKTDACETALYFCEGLDKRDSKATASHLRIVQDAVRDLTASLSPDSNERVMLLESRKAELQRDIDDLNAGIVYQLSEAEQRERIREVYQLASVLTGDFRRMEDDIRLLDQSLRVQMIEADSNRGEVLQDLLDKEEVLSESDAGQLAVLTGVGGGTLRDVILGVSVFWLDNPAYVAACLVTTVIVHFTASMVESRYRLLLWFDALGLAPSISPSARAYNANLSHPVLLVLCSQAEHAVSPGQSNPAAG